MAVITISRGSFTGGKHLAECLAERLNYRCVDRDVVVERAAVYGASQEDLRNALMKPPSFWDRFKHKKYVYLALIQAALTEEVRSGKAVYHGNAGHLLLLGVSHVLRVRIIAPLEFRIAMTQGRLNLSRSDAIAHISKMDQDRARWTHYLYGVNWGDPVLYDIVLNLENMDIQEACESLCAVANLKRFQETPESLAAMDNLALASRVRANLVSHPATVDLEIDVSAHAGVVTLKGKYRDPLQLSEARALAEKIPGVKELNLDDFVQMVDV